MNKNLLFSGLVVFVFVIVITTFISSQVVQTQVIELTEKVRNFFIEATKGNIIGQITISVVGHNEAVGVSEEDVQEQGGILIFLEAAEIHSFNSTSALDTIAGIGARSLNIEGLDANFSTIEEDLNLSGTTPVNTTLEYIRIQDVHVTTVGGYGNSNVGAITGYAILNRSVQTFIDPDEAEAHSSHYTVPLGMEAIITFFSTSIQTGKTIEITLKSRENADDTTVPVSPITRVREFHGLEGTHDELSFANLKFSEKTDVWFTAVGSGGGGSDMEIKYDLVQYAIGT